ncbi:MULTISPECIES: DUF3077 domain-containing protein [Pseudomonas]|jgi:hypothetical protein|uniref:DUF3077 domain-containing protein n=1 Tax=Pseudomonas TaxID=286 RepID=UPI000FAEBFEE|nr:MULTISPECIES: DUF3077 domain-containing protein [Pseudomonas]MBV7527864.1 DUF3077 domain-containing protein [Pseudomonas sp. PDM29]VVN12740.1 hypothetical protein PS647_03935 [Pseudomonas fluorescens]
MTKPISSDPSELKTAGFTPFLYLSNQPLFHVCRDVPIAVALAQASDLLFLAKSLTVDAAYTQDSDRHAWAAHYLTTMSKAVIDDVVKVLTRRPVQTRAEADQ